MFSKERDFFFLQKMFMFKRKRKTQTISDIIIRYHGCLDPHIKYYGLFKHIFVIYCTLLQSLRNCPILSLNMK